MLCSAPVATTEFSGQPSQLFAVSRAKYASGSGMNEMGSLTWPSQLILNASGGILNRTPMPPRTMFTAPLSWSKMLRQTVATMIGGMMTGRMNRAR